MTRSPKLSTISKRTGVIAKPGPLISALSVSNPYTNNVLFKLLELLCGLFEFVRRVASIIFIPGIIMIILYCFEVTDAATTLLTFLLSVYFGSLAGVFIFSLLAFLVRKLFRIDEKLEEWLGANFGMDLDDITNDSNWNEGHGN